MGSRKGDIKSIAIEIVWDSVEEGVETFSVHANITSPTTALFGGELQSSTGSISVDITNSGKSLGTSVIALYTEGMKLMSSHCVSLH